ncbi:glycosyltransferase [Mesorhizobium sp. YC-39]|uniref:glycosyltransferase n=1 Tax=unclassified Mesorhizobium TaxID=325217 RepID=UPI0021E7F227|nr:MULTISPECIES: glycosyltransferase [unclassified Mesorhizobium]MCV3210531.1 glycosyltransferase [Mesorhizobium sp. YC-2]MCV3232571.1 glycosyltransferase [Mesorhizobium sp. YC-39]
MSGATNRRKSGVRKTLRELHAQHDGKVSDKWSLYLETYEQLFSAFRDKPVRLLEIGVQNGGSLEIWRQYFPQAELILGCDINTACSKLTFDDKRIAVVVGDANTEEVECNIVARSSKFDIIIDDGSHSSSDIIRSFVRYFPHVSEGGMYIVEDLHCSYWQEFEGGLYDPFSSMSFFKRLVDVVNYEHWGQDRRRLDALAAFAERHKLAFEEASVESIHAIEFLNSLCVVTKRPIQENVLGNRRVAGSTALVDERVMSLDGEVNKPADQTGNPWSLQSATMEEEIETNRELVKRQEVRIEALSGEIAKARERIRSVEDAIAQAREQASREREEARERIAELSAAREMISTRGAEIAAMVDQANLQKRRIAGLSREIEAIRASRLWRYGMFLRRLISSATSTTLYLGRGIALRPLKDLDRAGVGKSGLKWIMTGIDPQFEMRLRWSHFFPAGHYRLRLSIESEDTVRPVLFFDSGKGFNNATKIELGETSGKASLRHTFSLPARALRMRFDPSEQPGGITVGSFKFRRMSRLEYYGRLAVRLLAPRLRDRQWLARAFRAALGTIRVGGVRGLAAAIRSFATADLRENRQTTWRALLAKPQEVEDAAFVESLRQRFNSSLDQFNVTKVSVVMPAYNRAHTIAAAIRSVQEQTHTNWELLVVDDGSMDRTKEVLREFAKDERIVLIEEDHQGVSAARNAGLRQASGELVAYLDSDNAWRPDYLRNMVVFMKSEGHECAYSAIAIKDHDGHITGYRGQEFDWDRCFNRNFVDLNVYCHLRGKDGLDIEFDPSLRRLVDWDFILRQTRGRPVGYAPFIGCDYADSKLDSGRISVNEPLLFLRLVQAKNSSSTPLSAKFIAENLSLTIAIKIPAPRAEKAEWGDFHFAESLAAALERLGHTVRIDFLREWYQRPVIDDDVVIMLRGLSKYEPRPGQVNIMWNISHPDQVSYAEYEAYDWVYVASTSYVPFLDFVVRKPVRPLLQATDTERFNPSHLADGTQEGPVLFVGNSRNEYRSIVRWAVERDLKPAVYGTLWEQFIPADLIKGTNVDNKSLGRLYAGSKVVLNDHWESMREFGFISNRLFDAVASGARVISDAIPSAEEVFGDGVIQVGNADELDRAVRRVYAVDDRSGRMQLAQRVASAHSFDRRARQIIDDVHRFMGLQVQGETGTGNESGSIGAPAVLTKQPIRVNAVIPWQRHPQSSAYIRLLSPLTAEVLAGRVDLKLIPAGEAMEARKADVSIVQRTAFHDMEAAERFADRIEKGGSRLIVDVDDGFICMDESHPEYEVYKDRNATLSALVRRADANWFSTRPLAEAYAQISSRSEIMPNMIDPRIWRNYRKPRPLFPTDGKLRLLYMGTATHDADFAMIADALDEVDGLRPNSFDLTIVGAVKSPPRRKWIVTLKPPAGDIVYPRFVRWLLDQTPFHVGLAPLVDNAFNRCKSDLKYLDYAALGILPILSDGVAYRDSATASGGAVLVQNRQEQWRDAVLDVIDHRERYSAMVQTAGRYVRNERNIAKLAMRQWESLNRLVTSERVRGGA